jgi:hypothetical protein
MRGEEGREIVRDDARGLAADRSALTFIAAMGTIEPIAFLK